MSDKNFYILRRKKLKIEGPYSREELEKLKLDYTTYIYINEFQIWKPYIHLISEEDHPLIADIIRQTKHTIYLKLSIDPIYLFLKNEPKNAFFHLSDASYLAPNFMFIFSPISYIAIIFEILRKTAFKKENYKKATLYNEVMKNLFIGNFIIALIFFVLAIIWFIIYS